MGIAPNVLELLLRMNKEINFSGAICQLGRQDIWIKSSEMKSICEGFGIQVSCEDEVMDDTDFFKLLGFSNVYSIDVTPYEGCTHLFDMGTNFGDVPGDLVDSVDVIFDGGTMEHVINPINFLNNVHNLLKVNGVIIHTNPVNGFFNHGYYQFSPNFYHDYYKYNQYQIIKNMILFQRLSDHWRTGPWKVKDLMNTGNGYGPIDQQTDLRIASFVCARKKIISTQGLVPNLQDMYKIQTDEFIRRRDRYNPKDKVRRFFGLSTK